MTQSLPGIFTTDFSLGSTMLNVTDNSTTSPKSLEVRKPPIEGQALDDGSAR